MTSPSVTASDADLLLHVETQVSRLGDGKGFAVGALDAEVLVIDEAGVEVNEAGVHLDLVRGRAVRGEGEMHQRDLRRPGQTDAAAVFELQLGLGIFGGVERACRG